MTKGKHTRKKPVYCSDCVATVDGNVVVCPLHAESPAMFEAMRRILEAHGACGGQGCFCEEPHAILARIEGKDDDG